MLRHWSSSFHEPSYPHALPPGRYYYGLMSASARALGLAAFVFFLVKGLLWLLVPAALFVWSC